jgi:hypothetical protein
VPDFNFVSGKVRRAGAFVSGQVDSVGAFVSGAVESVGAAVFPVFVPPVGPPAWIDYAWEGESLTALTPGDPIDSWTDDVSSGVVSASTTLRPVYALPPSADFDWINDVMTGLNAGQLNAMLSGATYTIAYCGKWLDYGAGKLSIAVGNTTGSAVRGAAIWFDGRVGQNKLWLAHSVGGVLYQTSTAITNLGDADYHTVICVATGAGNPATLYIDGVAVPSYVVRANLAAAAETLPEWRIGAAGTFPHRGPINGVYIATGYAASAAEVLALHNYRIAKGTL